MTKSQREDRIEELKSKLLEAQIFRNAAKIKALTTELNILTADSSSPQMTNDEVQKARSESIYDSNFCPVLQ